MNKLQELAPASGTTKKTATPKRTPLWVWLSITAVVALLAGLLIGKATIPAEVVTETVTNEVVPSACHNAMYKQEQLIGIYEEFVDNIQLELSGIPSGTGYYVELGNQRIELENDLRTLIPECNKNL